MSDQHSIGVEYAALKRMIEYVRIEAAVQGFRTASHFLEIAALHVGGTEGAPAGDGRTNTAAAPAADAGGAP